MRGAITLCNTYYAFYILYKCCNIVYYNKCKGDNPKGYYKGDKNHEIPNYIQKHNRSSRSSIH